MRPRFLALALLLRVSAVAGAVVAVGKLQSCVNDGTTPQTSLSCAQKIVTTLSLENNKIYETEQLNFGLACVDSPTGQCPCPCNYAADVGCTCRDLQQTISVAVTKSPVLASYPLTYTKSFNGHPTEAVILGSGCEDGWYSPSPTCGFATYKDAGGYQQDVMDSQGFCCRCTADEIIHAIGSPILGGNTQMTRGALNCASPGQRASAHCLRFDNSWWFAGFTVGNYALDFAVTVNITASTGAGSSNSSSGAPPAAAPLPAPLGASSTPISPSRGSNITGAFPPPPPPFSSNTSSSSSRESLKLSPSQPFVRSGGRSVAAQLLGDLEGYSQIPNLAGQYLLIPTYPGEGPQQSYSSHFNEWMLFPPGMVTLDGAECDKIGTGYSAFRNRQGGARCNVPAGSCLANQVQQLYYQDLDRVSKGLEPLYFIGRYGGGPDNTQQMSSERRNNTLQLALNLPLPFIKSSLVTLSVAADDVVFVVNRALARILSAKVCTYDNAICGGFQSMAARGFLAATVQNAGWVSADFTVGVVNCSAGVRPVQAQFASLAPQSSRDFTFALQMDTDQATASKCTLMVTDSLGDVTTSQNVSFYTNATVYEQPPDQSGLGDKVTGPGPGEVGYCKSACPMLLDLKCAAVHMCWGRLAKGLGAVVSAAAGMGLLWFCFRQGWVLSIARAVFTCFSGGSRDAATAPDGHGVSRNGQSSSKHGSRAQRRGGRGQSSEQEGAEAGAGGTDALVRVVSGAAGAASIAGKQSERGDSMQQAPPRGRRRRSSSLLELARSARESLSSGVQQTSDRLRQLRLYQYLISNPLAAGAPSGHQALEPGPLQQQQQQQLAQLHRMQQEAEATEAERLLLGYGAPGPQATSQINPAFEAISLQETMLRRDPSGAAAAAAMMGQQQFMLMQHHQQQRQQMLASQAALARAASLPAAAPPAMQLQQAAALARTATLPPHLAANLQCAQSLAPPASPQQQAFAQQLLQQQVALHRAGSAALPPAQQLAALTRAASLPAPQHAPLGSGPPAALGSAAARSRLAGASGPPGRQQHAPQQLHLTQDQLWAMIQQGGGQGL